jgi:hypothetical protein
MGVLSVGGSGWQMINELHAEVIAGLKLENYAFVGGHSPRIGRALVVDSNRGVADLINPASWAESAQVDGFGTGDQQQIEDAIGTGEVWRVERGLGGTTERGTEKEDRTRTGEYQKFFSCH